MVIVFILYILVFILKSRMESPFKYTDAVSFNHVVSVTFFIAVEDEPITQLDISWNGE